MCVEITLNICYMDFADEEGRQRADELQQVIDGNTAFALRFHRWYPCMENKKEDMWK